jgi:predicted small lipoprotein YifL
VRARPLAGVLVALALVAGLAACGKKNAPAPPPDADPAFPRQYPDPDTVLPEAPDDEDGGG